MKYRFTLVIVAALSGACDELFTPEASPPDLTPTTVLIVPPPPPAVTAMSRPLQLSARLYVSDGDDRPLWIAPQVTVLNTSADSTLVGDMCIAQFVATSTSLSRPGRWASSPQPRACPTASTSKIGPGRWTYLTDWNPAHTIAAILGDSLPDGSYAITAVVRAGTELIYVPAGTHMLVRENQPPLTDPELLEYSIGKSINDVAPSYLSVRIYARNPLSRSVHVEYGACSVKLWLYRNADLAGEPVWRSERRRGPNPDILYACPAYLASKTFLPNEVDSPPEFGIVVPMHEILADSLPNGRYHVLAELRFQEGSGQTLTHPTVRFNAGEVELRKDTAAIPRARMLDGVRYELSSALEASAVRLTFTATNTTSQSTFVGESPSVNCAGSLWGYLNAAHRDLFYSTEPQPDWRPLACAMVIPPTVIAPGATATFSTLVPIGATPHRGRDIHLIAALWLADQGAGDGLQRLILSAGQVRLP